MSTIYLFVCYSTCINLAFSPRPFSPLQPYRSDTRACKTVDRALFADRVELQPSSELRKKEGLWLLEHSWSMMHHIAAAKNLDDREHRTPLI